ncbi:MAG: dTDP-4-amino-4,6-dideoxygalactose transaminase [Sulfuricellaceae bacterium]
MTEKKNIPFGKPFIAGKELYYIAQAVMGGHLSGDGPFSARCEQWLEQHLDAPKALLTPSGTDALELAALLLDIGPGDEVIMPSFTFVSTATAFVLRGAVPVFVDIREDTLNLDERLVEAAITPRTRAIVAVHYGGCGCEMETLRDIADRHGLALIEDAAHALGASYRGRPLGSFGDLACFSFHETKNVISGEGGALVVNRSELVERAAVIRQKGTNRNQFLAGQTDKYTWVDIGSSFVASEIVAAFLWGQLERVEEITARRMVLWQQYYRSLEAFADAGNLSLPSPPPHCQLNGHIFYALARSGEERDWMLRYLNDRGVNAVFHYVPLHSSPAGLKYGRAAGSMEVTNSVGARLLRFPLYFEMTEDELGAVLAETAGALRLGTAFPG